VAWLRAAASARTIVASEKMHEQLEELLRVAAS
jgi:hypothetical protein